MALRSQRPWQLWLLIFLFFTIALQAHQPSNQEVSPFQPEQQLVEEPSVVIPQDQDGQSGHDHFPEQDIVPGHAAVEAARTIIRQKIGKPFHRVSHHNKPSGVFGTGWYYTKELGKLLFLNGPATNDGFGSWSSTKKIGQHLEEAVNLYEEAARVHNSDAVLLLADLYFFGRWSYPRNYTRAFDLYHELAMNGNSTAQHMLGFIYATGIGHVVEKDQAKALLYHTFAADTGSIHSEMTMGYRHLTGIGVPRNCEKALSYYKEAARTAIDYARQGPPGGRQIIKDSYRLADDYGGVYGEGASVSSSGFHAIKGAQSAEAHAAFDDVLEYLDLMSRKGEIKATFGLGRLHYDGSRDLKQDFRAAKDYFLEVARQYWTKDGKIRPDTEPGVDRVASKAAGYLGRMFLRGEGMEQNFQKARIWLRRGIDNGDALCQYSMGLMYANGWGVPQNIIKAAEYFGAAADQDLAAAQVKLGVLLLDQGDVLTAIKYFELASRNGHIEAFYYLAELTTQGIGKERNCNLAASYYKIVAEKAERLHSNFREANDAYEDGDAETAMLLYMMAAEQGYEVGQANVAWLLDRPLTKPSILQLLPIMKRQASLIADAALALIYWTRSAKQQNIDSMVKMGDYYLSGLGTDGDIPDSEKAAACYQAAAETLQSAQAMWNLGWMHENGIGIEQDFHLAKRFYDQALETNKEAYLPVTLALMKLRLRSVWNTITRGKVNPIHDEPKSRKRYSFSEWVANFLEADMEQYAELLAREEAADEWDTTATGHIPGEDLYDDIGFDDGMIETLVIVGIGAALAFLVYFRQQRLLQHRRQQQQQQAQNQAGIVAQAPVQQQQEGQRREGDVGADRGLFPGPGDPDFANWVVGGVGH